MTDAFDDRLVTLEIQLIGPDGKPEGPLFTFDQSYYILATGTKFTDGSLGECAVRIDNISKETRDFLVTKTSPWSIQRLYANINLLVGRKSTGTLLIFTGQATAANPSQPPDIGLTLTSLAMSALLGNIGSLSTGSQATLQSICAQIAAQLVNPINGKVGIPLDYQASYNPNIGSYIFNGPIIRQIQRVNQLGGVNAFIDNNTFVVLNANTPRKGQPITISKENGMIGVPEVNELGVTAKVLIGSNNFRPADAVTVKSQLNPAANGTFFIYKLGFDIASRDTSFYWNLDMRANLLGVSS